METPVRYLGNGRISSPRPARLPPGFGAISRTTRERPADTCSRRQLYGSRQGYGHEESMRNTDIAAPDYFHKVVDCQWACPAHTPVPEYIRLIAAGRYSDAYMVNWKSNVFPGNPRAHLRPSLRAGLPARARREGAGRDLPAQARRRRLQGRHHRPPAQARRHQERQAHRAGRRRPGFARGRARPRAARLLLQRSSTRTRRPAA